MAKDNQKIQAVIALTIGIFFAVLIAEAVLQVINIPERPISGWLNCKDKSPGECNSLGFRGREIVYSDDDFVVVLLGDSEVYAASFSFDELPERRLEHFLRQYKNNVKVFTIADMGYGQDQQYLALKKYFEDYKADLVLLMFTARNDVDNNFFPTSGSNNSIKPTYWLENGNLHGPTEGWLEPAGTRFKLALLWKSYIGVPIGESRIEMWKKNILPLPYQPLTKYEGEVDYSWQEQWNKFPQTALQGIEYERVGNSDQWAPRSKLREYGLQLTKILFSKMKTLVERNNANLIIFKENRPWELNDPDTKKVYYLNGNYYMHSIRQYKENLRELFDGYEHYMIPIEIKDYTVNQEDKHLNEQAIDSMMEKLSIILKKRGYL
jgi:hypothetical protein